MNINYKIKKIALLLVLIILNCKAEKKQEKPIDTINQGKVSILVNDLIAIKPEEPIIIDYYDPSDNITNEICIQIDKLYRKVRYEYGFYSGNFNYEEGKIVQENLENLLINFLRTEESWSIDVKKEMPFLDNFSVSEDNMVRIYSWYYDVASGDTDFSIIQYKAESGIINAVMVNRYDHTVSVYSHLGFRQGPIYAVGFKIEKYTYLIWALARGGGNAASADFIAVRLLDGKIEPYNAFNGDNNLSFLVLIGQDRGNINNLDVQFDKKHFWIRIIYNVRKDPKNYSQWVLDHPSFEKYGEPYIYDYLEFTFNGVEFIGDYKKLKEINDFTIYGN